MKKLFVFAAVIGAMSFMSCKDEYTCCTTTTTAGIKGIDVCQAPQKLTNQLLNF